MIDYGLKVSKPGFDVKTADDEDLVYTSKDNGWKILDEDSAVVNTSTTDAHGLSFAPAALVFHNYTDLEGNSGYYVPAGLDILLKSDGSTFGMQFWTDTTNLNLESTENLTAHWFLMIDPAETITPDSTAVTRDWGLKISNDGIDVKDAEDTDLSLTSKYKTLKESSTGTTTIDITSTALSAPLAAGATTMTVTSTAGFPSTGIVWVENSAGPLFAAEAIRYTGTTATTFTGLTRGYLGSSDVAHNNGLRVETQYGKATITHSLGYPPAFSVYLTASGFARQVVHFVNNSLPTGATAMAFSDGTTLEIRLERDDPGIAGDWGALDGTYPFRYYIFRDEIT